MLELPPPARYQGATGVLAKENTREAIFDALKARRCYAYMGQERIRLDFRINGHYMGEEITLPKDETRTIWIHAQTAEPFERITLVKNCRDHVILYGQNSQVLLDYKQETPCDCYYVRAITKSGRYAWSSPIWVTSAE